MTVALARYRPVAGAVGRATADASTGTAPNLRGWPDPHLRPQSLEDTYE